MAKGKLTDLQKKKIIADYIENQNYLETSKMNDVSVETVRTIVNKDEETRNILKQKKEENTLTTLEYMETQHQTKKRILNKLLHAIELKSEDLKDLNKLNVRDLATAYGILIDKELKFLELKRGSANNDDLRKVEELLGKLEQEAKVDITNATNTE